MKQHFGVVTFLVTIHYSSTCRLYLLYTQDQEITLCTNLHAKLTEQMKTDNSLKLKKHLDTFRYLVPCFDNQRKK